MMHVLLCSPLVTGWTCCAHELVLPGLCHLLELLSPLKCLGNKTKLQGEIWECVSSDSFYRKCDTVLAST